MDSVKKMCSENWCAYLTSRKIEDLILDSKRIEEGDSSSGERYKDDPLLSRLPLRFVYLSADADETFAPEDDQQNGVALSKDLVCVVGGLVDRNRHKGCCQRKATALNIPTARFPLDTLLGEHTEYVGTRVLTTNHGKQCFYGRGLTF